MTHKIGCLADDPFAHLLGDAGKCRCDMYWDIDEFRDEMERQGYIGTTIPVLDEQGYPSAPTIEGWIGQSFSIGRQDRGENAEKGCYHHWRVYVASPVGSIERSGEIRDTASGLIYRTMDGDPMVEDANLAA